MKLFLSLPIIIMPIAYCLLILTQTQNKKNQHKKTLIKHSDNSKIQLFMIFNEKNIILFV